MLQTVLYFIPCLVCFFWALIYAMRQNDRVIKFLRDLLFTASFYYLAFAFKVSPHTEHMTMCILDLLTQPFGLMVLAMNLGYSMYVLSGKRHSTKITVIMSVPIVFQTVAAWSTYLAVGFSNIAGFYASMDVAWTRGASYLTMWEYLPQYDISKYHLFIAVVHYSYNLIAAVFGLAVLWFIFGNMLRNKYGWGTMFRFFFFNRAVSASSLVSLLMVLLMVLMMPIVALGRNFFFMHPIVGGAITFVLGAVLYILALVTIKPEVNFFTLGSVFRIDPFCPGPGAQIMSHPDISNSYVLLAERLKVALEDERVFLNPDLNLNDFAEHLGTNRTTLSNLINHSYGKSFKNLVADKRIEYALKYMKEHPGARVEEVADLSGFNNPSVFYNRFKEATGTSPRQWKIRNCPK